MCLQEVNVIYFTDYLAGKLLFHSPMDDRVSKLQSVVNDMLPTTAFSDS